MAALPSCYRRSANHLLACRQFTSDDLLIAADAFGELSRHAQIYGGDEESGEARQLAEQLRALAPHRAKFHKPQSYTSETRS